LLNSLLSATSIASPLRLPVYRGSWGASIISNMGMMILGVGAGWTMTQLTKATEEIALVQTAMTLPITILALPAGAIADMYDRRIVGFFALSIALLGATLLVLSTFLGVITPAAILGFCFIIAGGAAVFNPAWQASVNDQVPHELLPAAVALNSISFNLARCLGPAIGGVIVAGEGSGAAFVATAIGFIPMLAVLYRWPTIRQLSQLPPESLRRAMISGVRYVIHSPQIPVVLTRTVLISLSAASIPALMPLIVRDQLSGNARTYGAMLAAFGVGGIISAVIVPRVRRTFDHELAVRAALFMQAGAAVVVAFSHVSIVTALALVVCGAGYLVASVLCNVGIQLSSPRWVSARVLAIFQATITAGFAIGSWAWGMVAKVSDLETAILLSAGSMIITLAVGLRFRMPHIEGASRDCVSSFVDPEVTLPVGGHSGPIVLEIEYRVPVIDARAFYNTMLEVQLSRQRNGAHGWSIARDVRDLEIWIERLQYPTWHDYLRQHHRVTLAERELQARATAFHQGPEPVRIRQMLERPYDSGES
jgi:MFS family permease